MYGRIAAYTCFTVSISSAAPAFGSWPFQISAAPKASWSSSSTVMPHFASLAALAGSNSRLHESIGAASPSAALTLSTLMPRPVVPHM